MTLIIPHRQPDTREQHQANWQAIEVWAGGRLQVIAYSFPGALSAGLSPGFVAPNPLTVIAFHLFLITAGSATSTFDLMLSGSSVFSTAPTMASGVKWARFILPRPRPMKSVLDVINSRAALPDYLQAKITTAGATAADLYCGAEFQN